VSVATEAAEEAGKLLMHHGVAADRVVEPGQFILVGQLAIEQQIAGLHEGAVFCKLADGIAAMQQHAFVTVDVGQRAFAACRRGETRIVGEGAGLAVELADVDHIRPNGALQHRSINFRAAKIDFGEISHNSSP
jgi:hypothetical protein